MKRAFDGKVSTDGKMTIYDQEGFSRHYQQFKGMGIRITVERGGKRTNKQNAWLWGVAYKLLSDHLGYTPEEIHEVCKQKFNSKPVEITNKQTGETETIIIGATTTDLNKLEEWESFKEQVQRLGASLGVVIPDPGQTEWLGDEV